MGKDSDERRRKRQKVATADPTAAKPTSEAATAAKTTSEAGPDGHEKGCTRNIDLPLQDADTFSDEKNKREKPNMVVRSCGQSVRSEPLMITNKGGNIESALAVTMVKDINRFIDMFPEHGGRVIDTLLSLSHVKVAGDATGPRDVPRFQDHATPASHSTSGVGLSDGEQSDMIKLASVVGDLEEIKQDTLQKLRQFIRDREGELEDGWEVEILKKRGRVDKYFVSPSKKKFRSPLDVARFLGLSGKTKGKSGETKENAKFVDGLNGKALQFDDSQEIYYSGKQGEDSDSQIKLHSPGFEREVPLSASAKYYVKESQAPKLGKTNKKNIDEVDAAAKFDAGQNSRRLLPSPALVSQRCQDVLRGVISADKFGAICSMFQGGPGSWEKGFQTTALTTGALDFQLLNLRMATGAYGETPEMFLVDLQQVWKNIDAIGNELVLLADSLSKLSQNLYKKQVVSLFSIKPAEGQDGVGMQENLEQTISLCAHGLEQEPVDMSAHLYNEDQALKENIMEPVEVFQQLKSQVECVLSQEVVEKGLQSTSVVEKGSNHSPAAKRSRKSGGHSQSPSQVKKSTAPKSPNPSKATSEEKACKVCGDTEGTDHLICSSCNTGYHEHCLIPAVANLPDTPWCCPTCVPTTYTKGSPVLQPLLEMRELHPEEAERFSLVPQQRPEYIVNSSGTVAREPLKIMRKDGLCKSCGKDDQQVLLCDSCESAYHMQCLSPALSGVPEGNWYCPTCTADGKKARVSCPPREIGHQLDGEHTKEPPHQCPIFDRISEEEQPALPVETAFVPHRAAVGGKICRLCGINDKRYLLCCDACSKPYHITCLKPPLKIVPTSTWYCPSCLCRACKVDSDDDKILLCDGCDEGYHTYCLSPPLENIPEGSWYCPSCTLAKTRINLISYDLKKPLEDVGKKELPKRKRKSTEPKRST